MEREDVREQKPKQDVSGKPGKTSLVVGLFVATALAMSVGCSDEPKPVVESQPAQSMIEGTVADDYCEDANDDDVCDDGGGNVSTHSAFIWVNGTKRYYSEDKYKRRTYASGTQGTGASGGFKPPSSSGTPGQSVHPSNVPTPPKSSSGTGQVISGGKSSSGSSSSSGSASSGSGISSGKSGAGGIGSSSGSSSS
jgi:hypothetical protein